MAIADDRILASGPIGSKGYIGCRYSKVSFVPVDFSQSLLRFAIHVQFVDFDQSITSQANRRANWLMDIEGISTPGEDKLWNVECKHVTKYEGDLMFADEHYQSQNSDRMSLFHPF